MRQFRVVIESKQLHHVTVFSRNESEAQEQAVSLVTHGLGEEKVELDPSVLSVNEIISDLAEDNFYNEDESAHS